MCFVTYPTPTQHKLRTPSRLFAPRPRIVNAFLLIPVDALLTGKSESGEAEQLQITALPLPFSIAS